VGGAAASADFGGQQIFKRSDFFSFYLFILLFIIFTAFLFYFETVCILFITTKLNVLLNSMKA
jgi:hypothetical protein